MEVHVEVKGSWTADYQLHSANFKLMWGSIRVNNELNLNSLKKRLLLSPDSETTNIEPSCQQYACMWNDWLAVLKKFLLHKWCCIYKNYLCQNCVPG